MNKHLDFTTNTKVLGIMGYPVAHSVSPVMQNAALDFWDLDWVYLAFAVPPRELKAALTGIKTFGFTEVNITIPYKEAVIPCLDLLTPEAEALGAVNVIRQENQKLIGHNTDGAGFLQALAEEFDFCPMLLYQGALSFTWWTGLSAPVAVMRQALMEHLSALPRTKGRKS